MVKMKLIVPGGRTAGEFVLVVLGVLVALMVETLTYHVSQVDVAVYLYGGQIRSVLDILAQLEPE